MAKAQDIVDLFSPLDWRYVKRFQAERLLAQLGRTEGSIEHDIFRKIIAQMGAHDLPWHVGAIVIREIMYAEEAGRDGNWQAFIHDFKLTEQEVGIIRRILGLDLKPAA